MKRLFVLTAVLMLTPSAVGCNNCRGLFRGTFLNPCPPEETFCDPCAPVVTPSAGCNPCMTAPPATMVAPGPATYVPTN